MATYEDKMKSIEEEEKKLKKNKSKQFNEDEQNDLPNVGKLKRTGRIGEIVSESYRKEGIEKANKEISSARNKPAGVLSKAYNLSPITSSRQQIKDFAKEEKDKPKRVSAAKARLKELKTRR